RPSSGVDPVGQNHGPFPQVRQVATSAATPYDSSLELAARDARELVQVVNEGARGALEAREVWIRRLDDEVLVGRVRAAAVTETEVAGGQPERCIREHVSR